MSFWDTNLKFCTVVRTRHKSFMFDLFRLVSMRFYAPNKKTFTAYFLDVPLIGSIGIKSGKAFRWLINWLDPWDGTDTTTDNIMCRDDDNKW